LEIVKFLVNAGATNLTSGVHAARYGVKYIVTTKQKEISEIIQFLIEKGATD
jgi:hypothetical protein